MFCPHGGNHVEDRVTLQRTTCVIITGVRKYYRNAENMSPAKFLPRVLSCYMFLKSLYCILHSVKTSLLKTRMTRTSYGGRHAQLVQADHRWYQAVPVCTSVIPQSAHRLWSAQLCIQHHLSPTLPATPEIPPLHRGLCELNPLSPAYPWLGTSLP